MRGGILFVDDDVRVLEGLENVLFDHDEAWGIAFATSGADALQSMSEHVFDVVVTDMRMPGMDGAALIEAIRARWPETICIVLSGRTELDQARRALPLIMDYLAKPVSPERLIATLSRALALARSCRSAALKRVVGRLTGLPPRPRTPLEFDRLVARGAPLDEVAALLEQDPAITASLLHIVNSAFFASSRPVDQVRDAIVRLGLEYTGQVVMAASAFAAANPHGDQTEVVFEHSCEVARVAQAIVAPADRRRAFLAGMLHDLGHVLMARHFPEASHLSPTATGTFREPDPAQEEAVLGFGHAHCGAYLLRLWNLDDDVAMAVEHHHDPTAIAADERALAQALLAADVAVQEASSNATWTPEDVVSRAREIVAAGGRA